MRRLLRFFLIFSTLYLLSPLSRAAVLKGLVTDTKTGEPLAGAPVTLAGTAYVSVTGLDGSYEFKNVPGGNYKIITHYGAYEKWEKEITLTQDETKKLNISLKQGTTELKEVQVKTHFKNGSDEQARNKEKNSDQLMNVMSARNIELLPDITVANVLQRVSGVTVQRDATGDARYAVIRGMDKRYSYTTVNGVKIPSPDDKGRYIPMDIFPAEIIDRLDVIKTLTPNMEGDAIGGVMNLVMKDAPERFTLSASAATGVNELLLGRSFTKFNASAINAKDPGAINGTAYNAVTNDFTRANSDFQHVNVMPNALFSLTVGDRFLKDKKLGVVFSGSYQNTYKGSDQIIYVPSAQPDIGNSVSLTDLMLRQYSTQETRTGLHTKIDYRFNARNQISLYGLFLQLNEKESRYTVDTTVNINRTGAGTGPVDITSRSAFRKQNIINATLMGNHILTDRLKVDWRGAISRATRDVPDLAEIHTSTGATRDSSGNQVVQPEIIKSWHHSWENTKDQDYEGYADITYTPEIFGKDVEIMGGGMYRHKDRNNYYNEYTLEPTSSRESFTDIYAASFNVSNPKGVLPYNDLTYTVTENISAYYLQAKFMLGDKLQVLGGARMENTYQHYTIAKDPNVFVGQNGTIQYSNLLPSLHFKYNLDQKQALRLSYFKSITRPGFFEIVPYIFPGEVFDEGGNYNLRPATANNIDARYEWFPKGIDQVLVGAFYKNISDPIEYALLQNGGPSSQIIKPINQTSQNATNYGLEVVLTKYFHRFGVSLNYTYTHSSIVDSVRSYVRDAAGNATFYNVTETHPLQGQATHVGNLSLIYKYQEIGLDAHLTCSYTGPMIAYISPFIGLDYWQKGMATFAFSVEKRIAKHVYAYAKINNLLNTARVVEMKTSKDKYVAYPYELPYQTLPNSVLIEKDLYGRNYLVGIRFKLN